MIQLGRNALGRDFMGYSSYKTVRWCIASRGAGGLKGTNLTHLIGSYISQPAMSLLIENRPWSSSVFFRLSKCQLQKQFVWNHNFCTVSLRQLQSGRESQPEFEHRKCLIHLQSFFYQGNKGEAKTKANEATCFLKDISDTNWSDLVATCVPHKRYCCHLLVPLYQCVVGVPCKNFHHRNVVPSVPEYCLPHLGHTI